MDEELYFGELELAGRPLAARVRTWIDTSHLEPSTLETYEQALEQVLGYGIARIEDLTSVAIARYLVERRAAGTKPATCNRNLTALCSFVHWLARQGEAPHRLLFELRDLRVREEKPPVDWLPPSEFLELRAIALAIDEDLDLGVALVYGSGFRLSELRQLRHEDLELAVELPYARVLRTHGRRVKRCRERTTPVPGVLARELLERGFGRGREGWIFPARYPVEGLPVVSQSSMQEWLDEGAARLGRHVNWLTLRHSFASRLTQKNVSAAKVAYFMGNSVKVVSERYVAHAPGGDADAERAGFPVAQPQEAAA